MNYLKIKLFKSSKEKLASGLLTVNKTFFRRSWIGHRHNEPLFPNEERKRAAELIIANKELLFQKMKKRKSWIIANKELLFKMKKKKTRARINHC
jgi:hypothetical protein